MQTADGEYFCYMMNCKRTFISEFKLLEHMNFEHSPEQLKAWSISAYELLILFESMLAERAIHRRRASVLLEKFENICKRLE